MVDFGRIGENVDPSGVELLDKLLGVEANRRVEEVVDGCNGCRWLSYLNCANFRGNRRGRRGDMVDDVICVADWVQWVTIAVSLDSRRIERD